MLQINPIFNDVLARTSSIAAFVFSVAGLVLSASFVLNIHQFNRRKCRNQWISVCRLFYRKQIGNNLAIIYMHMLGVAKLWRFGINRILVASRIPDVFFDVVSHLSRLSHCKF
jgi:hypothetical protein